MEILEKVRKLPLGTRKIILWVIVALCCLFLLLFWFKTFEAKIERFEKNRAEFNQKIIYPEIEMPKIEMPEIPEQIEEILEELEEK